jgi:nucleoside-diphosphate-sugar epimerase
MKILFIGGTGIISTACSNLALAQGHELHLLNRGSAHRILPTGVHHHQADIRKAQEVLNALGDHTFDVVVEWLGFEAHHVEADISWFKHRTKQYIYISSASVYQKPPQRFPITEATPIVNPFWKYAQDKIACEQVLIDAYESSGFPVTIVRPSHTYDKTFIPVPGRYTVVDRMKKGKQIIVQGDGTSLWTLTHSRDFAIGFNGLFGKQAAIGQDFHITSDQWLNWNNIIQLVADAAGVEPNIVHIPSDFIASIDPEFGANMLGDKSHSAIFDNSKIKALVPEFNATIAFQEGILEAMEWHEADPARQVINEPLSDSMDAIIKAYNS